MRTFRSPASPVRSRIYEKIIWQTLRARRYDSIAALAEDVKVRCAQLRVPYQRHEIDDAIATMGDKITRELAPVPTRHVERAPDPAPLTKAEAAAILARITARVGDLAARPKVMPTARPVTPRDADRRAAARIVAQAIVDAVERCEAVERDEEPAR